MEPELEMCAIIEYMASSKYCAKYANGWLLLSIKWK